MSDNKEIFEVTASHVTVGLSDILSDVPDNTWLGYRWLAVPRPVLFTSN